MSSCYRCVFLVLGLGWLSVAQSAHSADAPTPSPAPRDNKLLDVNNLRGRWRVDHFSAYLFSASKRLYRYTAQVEWMKFLEN